jgi:hypothetical protein
MFYSFFAGTCSKLKVKKLILKLEGLWVRQFGFYFKKKKITKLIYFKKNSKLKSNQN